jgi:hypothetical protein
MFLPLKTRFLMVGKKIALVFVKAKQIWLVKKLYVHFQLPIDVLTNVFINNLPLFKHKNLPLESTHIPLNEISSSWGSLNMRFLIVKPFIENRSIVWGTSPTIISKSWIFIIYFFKGGGNHM